MLGKTKGQISVLDVSHSSLPFKDLRFTVHSSGLIKDWIPNPKF